MQISRHTQLRIRDAKRTVRTITDPWLIRAWARDSGDYWFRRMCGAWLRLEAIKDRRERKRAARALCDAVTQLQAHTND